MANINLFLLRSEWGITLPRLFLRVRYRLATAIRDIFQRWREQKLD
jgi:hypothetical protein